MWLCNTSLKFQLFPLGVFWPNAAVNTWPRNDFCPPVIETWVACLEIVVWSLLPSVASPAGLPDPPWVASLSLMCVCAFSSVLPSSLCSPSPFDPFPSSSSRTCFPPSISSVNGVSRLSRMLEPLVA